MKSKNLSVVSRILLLMGALALLMVLNFPMWRIELDAPQYPEGLQLLIYPHKLGGNVDIINGLNHYIGMKTLHKEDFIEFTLLPWIVGFFALLFLWAAVMGSRKRINGLFILFVLFGVIAMVDFWRWEYNYGHNLDPNAAIVVPGMAYQPPLIGFKQLLNFGAFSIPDTGGWLFIASGVFLLAVVWIEWKRFRRTPGLMKNAMLVPLFSLSLMQACSSGPDPIKTGVDQCQQCKMTMSDPRFGAELETKKGKLYKFDDIHCLLAFRKSGAIHLEDIQEYYFTGFTGKNELIIAGKAFFLYSEDLHSPMGGNIAAFSSEKDRSDIMLQYPGKMITLGELLKQ